MTKRGPRLPEERVRSWLSADVDGLALLEADLVRHRFPRHTHEGYMVSVIEAGAQALTHRGQTLPVGHGRVVVVPPGEVHSGRAAVEQGWRYRVFTVPEHLFARADREGHRQLAGPAFGSTVLEDGPLAGALVEVHRAFAEPASGLEREVRLLAALGALVERHAVDVPPEVPVRRADRRVASAREYLHAHWAENVRLETLAEVAGLAPLYLVRLFTAQLGLPPHAYQIQLRIRRAQRLLARGEPTTRVA